MTINKGRGRLVGAGLLALGVLMLCALGLFWPRRTADGHTPDTVSFSVGERTYTLTLEDATAGTPRFDTPDVRPLCTRTRMVLPLLGSAAQGETPPEVGTVTLTVDETDTGTVFYLSSDSPAGVRAVLTTQDDDKLTVRAIDPDDEETAEPAAPRFGTAYSPDSALYLEGDAVHLYLSRPSALTALGQSVYVCKSPMAGASLARGEGTLSLLLPLPAGLASCSGIVTDRTLVNWNNTEAHTNVRNLDASVVGYHLQADGVYIAMPDTYRPYDTRADGRHIYRAATAWLLGPCTYDTNGPMFTALGKSIIYRYLDSVNAQGFLPTEPSSTWLSSEYGIDAGFYDTRFNFDTIKRLMRAETLWDDPAIGKTVQRMVSFYLDFADAAQFKAYDVTFVPDYGHPAPNAVAPSKAACSLNHYLTEGLLLLRAGERYGDARATKRGYDILKSINETAARWITPGRDLWYAIRQDGKMEKPDYIQVTYLDLADAAHLLTKYGVWNDYPGIQALLALKEEWLIDHGYRDMLTRFPDFTAFG